MDTNAALIAQLETDLQATITLRDRAKFAGDDEAFGRWLRVLDCIRDRLDALRAT